jgi:hypothetical protein
MKKLLFLIAAVSGLLVGCSQQEDMSSPPASTDTNTTTSTNQ